MTDIDAKFEPASADDVRDDNPSMLAGHMRALQREVRSGFELITSKLLTAIERINAKLDDQSSEIADLKRWQSQTDARLTALEKRPKRAGKKR